MKVLSIRQPWAWLVVTGHKDIENRKWPTLHRGRLLIHAGKTPLVPGVLEYVQERYGVEVPEEELRFGGIIVEVTIADVVSSHPSKWFRGPLGWVFTDARTFPFRPMPGRLKLWQAP